MSARLLLAALCGCCGLTACHPDPVRDQMIARLGPEARGVPAGPLHRPGQPCLACHSEDSTASVFSLAGTIYREKGATQPANEAEVVIVDSAGQVHSAKANCAGNFFVRPSEMSPKFPLWLTVRFGDQAIDMESPVYREGSCSACHADPEDRSSAGHVFLTDDPRKVVAPSPPCASTDRRPPA